MTFIHQFSIKDHTFTILRPDHTRAKLLLQKQPITTIIGNVVIYTCPFH